MLHRCVHAFAFLAVALVPVTTLAQSNPETRDPAGLRRLQDQTGGAVDVSVHKSTGAARVIRLKPGAVRSLGRGPAASLEEKRQHSRAFFRDYAALLGIADVASMQFVDASTDLIGETHLTWKQTHGNVPVFGTMLRTHFDKDQQLKAVAGTAVPDIRVNATPSIARARAERAALDFELGKRAGAQLRTGSVTLYVYRQGLAQGIPGENLLAWEIEVTNGAGIRQLVYVDAHTGKVIDSITGIQDELNRRAYDGRDLPNVPKNYPNGTYWTEGERFPTASLEANNMITSSQETHALFKGAFNRDSFDGKGATMDAIFNRGYDCPNASWNGTFISFCPGFTTDDITTHEWAHAYTQYTHGLIYQWQPGALNEAYSDIWGEVLDLINGRGNDDHDTLRGTGTCSASSPPVAQAVVNSPPSIAGSKPAQSAAFGTPLTATGITADVVAALDADEDATAATTTLDACSPLTNSAAVSGKIALVNRGGCEFSTKVLNAQNAGAVAAIVVNNAAAGLPGMGPGVVAAQVTIPSVGILQSDGNAMREALAAGSVNTTLLARPGTDQTVRWLMGEDNPETLLRDMFNPNCHGNPGKVTDATYYVCDVSDSGGVHTNSGIPNHAFALLVDGGTYNGKTVGSIGVTKAAHIYYRAQTVYQVFDSDFADHAVALESSCSDLAGKPLPGLTPGAASVEITPNDCAQVENAIAAVELKTPPPCSFAPMFNPAQPNTCSTTFTSGVTTPIFGAGFEAATEGFVTETTAAAHQWSRVAPPANSPQRVGGSSFFAPNPNASCEPLANDTSLAALTSPEITLPAGTDFARATFDQWVATEPGWDGGNLKISVNGGAFQLIPPSAYSFNGHNVLLFSAEQGNTNPLAGQPSWSGNTAGTVNGGSWGTTLVNLGGFAKAGDKVRLRWDFGTDVCSGRTGWFVDNVSVFSCKPNVPELTVNDPELFEGNDGKHVINFTVSMTGRNASGTRVPQGSLRTVRVFYSIVDGTAVHGDDFHPTPDGFIDIPTGFAGGTIGIVLKGDVTPEATEHFFVRLTGAVNATVLDGEGKATIKDDDTRTTITTTTPPEN
jgi:Zn-dependent metalloprotease